jgi:hypothetical protein
MADMRSHVSELERALQNSHSWLSVIIALLSGLPKHSQLRCIGVEGPESMVWGLVDRLLVITACLRTLVGRPSRLDPCRQHRGHTLMF